MKTPLSKNKLKNYKPVSNLSFISKKIVIISIHKGEVTALTLLDLSAVFDTITHATLTNILSDCYGISGQAQIRFSSYLQNSYQSVKIKTLCHIKSQSHMVP